MLLVSSPHIHCGHKRKQKTIPVGFQCTDISNSPLLKPVQTTSTPSSSSSSMALQFNVAQKYYYNYNHCRASDTVSSDSNRDESSMIRMEDYTVVDCTRHGGNDALIADSITRAVVVMCDGHGSLSMLGRAHSNEICLGGAEMARLAAHSLLNEMYLDNASLQDAFTKTSALLLRYSLEGAARHSMLSQSLLDGYYFQWLATLDTHKVNHNNSRTSVDKKSIQRDTIVSKTCELREKEFVPTTRYVTQSGERIDPLYGTTATVIECKSGNIRVCNIGDTLAAVFTPDEQLSSHTQVSNEQNPFQYRHAWLTETHNVSNPKEVKRMSRNNNVRVNAGGFTYTVPNGTHVDADSILLDKEVCRLSRSMGHQYLRSQGMLSKPATVLVQQFIAGQIAVVATFGVWHALGSIGNDVKNPSVFDENHAANIISNLFLKEKSREPNVLADLILTTALEKAGKNSDNMSVVVLLMT